MNVIHQEAIRTDHTINHMMVLVEQCIDILLTPGHDFKCDGGAVGFLEDCSAMIAKLIELFAYRIALLESLFTYGDLYYAASN